MLRAPAGWVPAPPVIHHGVPAAGPDVAEGQLFVPPKCGPPVLFPGFPDSQIDPTSVWLFSTGMCEKTFTPTRPWVAASPRIAARRAGEHCAKAADDTRLTITSATASAIRTWILDFMTPYLLDS
jgi:hypothetical protein